MELYLSSTYCLFSCVQTRRSGMSQRWHRSPYMPVGRNFTATAVVCLQTLIRFVRFLLAVFVIHFVRPTLFERLYHTLFGSAFCQWAGRQLPALLRQKWASKVLALVFVKRQITSLFIVCALFRKYSIQSFYKRFIFKHPKVPTIYCPPIVPITLQQY